MGCQKRKQIIAAVSIKNRWRIDGKTLARFPRLSSIVAHELIWEDDHEEKRNIGVRNCSEIRGH